jgi:hypothetical protein
MNAESLRNSFRALVLRGEKPPLVIADKNRRSEGDESLDGDMVARMEMRSSNHRLKDRHRLSGETATILHAGRIIPVEVINLSHGGAMVRGAFEPKLWEIVELQIGEGFGIEAAVRWLKDDRVGLEFAHETRIECDPEERAELLLEVIRRSFDEQDIQFAPEEDYGPGFAAESGQDLGKRDERRHPLIWVGEIHYAHDTNPTRLRNVSEGGALIDVAADYPPGAEVLLDLAEGGQVFGTIVWTCGDQAGLRFKEPFDIGCLARVRPQLMPTNWRAPTFLEDGADGDSPWNENWSRSSLAEMRSELEGYLKR